MSRLIAFDFDGVVIDSISALKSVYYDFLNQFGKKGSDVEFDSLNGPTIDEIVLILKNKYDLEDSFKVLLDKYRGLLTEAYSAVPLIEGIQSVLEDLSNQGVDLALVTSSVRSEVELILHKHQIDKKFKFIITGNDVKESKPSPEIYLLLKKLSNENEIWTIEDSDNGIKSAREANINVIYLDHHNTGTTQYVDCRVNDIREILPILKGIEEAYCVVEKASEIKVQVDESYFPFVTHSENKIIEEFWKKAQSSKNLHDGKALYYLSHETKGGKVTVKAFWGAYRYFYCTLNHPTLGLNFAPLAVSGICLDKRGFTLTAKRKNVTEYSKSSELVPSGGISESVKSENSIDFHKQLLTELFEEASIEAENVSRIKDIGMVRDLSNQVIDICCQIDLDGDVELSSMTNDEYSLLSWIDLTKIDCKGLIPTSRGILNILDDAIEKRRELEEVLNNFPDDIKLPKLAKEWIGS
jgi:HAD superfamily hydrolase (TIGR01509 family)